MVSPSKFCHVVYKTHRFEEMIEWYTKVFEARVQFRDDRLAFLTYDEEHHRFAFANLGPVSGENPLDNDATQRVAHVAYAWDSLQDLLETYKRLKAMGVKPPRPLRHGLTLSLYYADPDGNNMEFQIDLMSPDAANRFMASPAFDANPIGEAFDPDELVARYEKGEPVDDLIFRSDQPDSRGAAFAKGRPEPAF